MVDGSSSFEYCIVLRNDEIYTYVSFHRLELQWKEIKILTHQMLGLIFPRYLYHGWLRHDDTQSSSHCIGLIWRQHQKF